MNSKTFETFVEDLQTFLIILRILIKNSFIHPHNVRLICRATNSTFRSYPQRMGLVSMDDLNEVIELDLKGKLRITHLILAHNEFSLRRDIPSIAQDVCHDHPDIPSPFIDIDSSRFRELEHLTHLEIRLINALTHYPSNLIHLTTGYYFNHELINLPLSLKSLVLGYNYNQSLDGLSNLSNLSSLTTGDFFNESLDNLSGLPFLTNLSLGHDFNKSLDNLPVALTHLSLGYGFNQKIDNLPASLIYLSMNECGLFNQEIDQLPVGISYLKLSFYFNHSIDYILNHLLNLQYLFLGVYFSQPISSRSDSLETLSFWY